MKRSSKDALGGGLPWGPDGEAPPRIQPLRALRSPVQTLTNLYETQICVQKASTAPQGPAEPRSMGGEDITAQMDMDVAWPRGPQSSSSNQILTFLTKLSPDPDFTMPVLHYSE